MPKIASKPLAEARSRLPQPNGNSALLVNEDFAQPEDTPDITSLLTEVLDLLKRQEGEIHQLGCVIKQQERRIQHQDEEIATLKQETARQKEEIVNEAQAPLLEEIDTLKVEVATLKDRLGDTRAQLIGLEIAQDDLEAQLANNTPSTAPPPGTKTARRIEETKEYLKRHRGRATFSDLKEELKLSDSQFSKLVKKLDMRRFEVKSHPQKRREKILILRQQIG